MSLRHRCLGLLVIVLTMTSGPHVPVGAVPDHMPGVPRLLFWAWERPEDLRGLDPRAGVAFLAATYRLRSSGTETLLRRQPLKVDGSTPLIAVVRIETDTRDRPVPNTADAEWLAGRIATLRTEPAVRAIQIDFDATSSERGFYRELLAALRRSIGTFPLSMTALASWCMSDHWIDGLPVDEAVPMLFRMGPANVEFITAGAAGRMRAPLCSGAVGISTDEPTPALRGNRRTYIFNPKSWTSPAIARATTEVTRWQ